MRKEFNKLQELLFNGNTYDSNGNDNWVDVHVLLTELENKIDEVEKRMKVATMSAEDIRKTIGKYTDDVDKDLPINMSVNDHDVILNSSDDVTIALDLDDNMCVVDNWNNLFSPKEELKPVAVGNIEYDFPEEVYAIGNADNSEIIGDVYESDFIRLCELGLIWCDSDRAFPTNSSPKANYVVRNNEFIVVVKNKQIDLSKVPIIKKEVFMTFHSSWGEIDCDEDGNVMEIRGDREINGESNYLYTISKFDLVEFGKFCESKNITMGEAEDIMSVGFWKHGGTYSEAEKDWRKQIFGEEPPTELCKIPQTHEFVKDIIAKLKVIDVDGETMEYILKQVGMDEQMAKQLNIQEI